VLLYSGHKVNVIPPLGGSSGDNAVGFRVLTPSLMGLLIKAERV
jgi:hypothetical protein